MLRLRLSARFAVIPRTASVQPSRAAPRLRGMCSAAYQNSGYARAMPGSRIRGMPPSPRSVFT